MTVTADAGFEARRAAVEALSRVRARRASLDTVLEAVLPAFDLPPRERAFARSLVVTALRHAGEIDAILDRCLERPLPDRARIVHWILAIGAAQILYLGTAPHAAVDTAVRLAEANRQVPLKGLVNAVLRRIARDGETLCAGLDAPRLNTPDWLWASWEDTYGAATCRAIAEAHLEEPPLDLTLRVAESAAEWAERLDATAMLGGTLRCRRRGAVSELPGFDEGAWWVQDVAAAFPVRLFPDIKRARIADLCAAPGGKTMQLAAAGAEVSAVDISAKRLVRIKENLARTGLGADLIEMDARAFRAAEPFDGVLLDAPCTATGTLRRHPDIAYNKSPGDVAKLIDVQDALLAAAAGLVRPGGILVYAVCSLQPEEGPERIAGFLAERPHWARRAVTAGEIGGLTEATTADGDLRTLPCHRAAEGGMDGFYAARLQAPGEAAT
jgi:16S rRNA (cytosine967-C5)-methyltransferase